MRWEKDNIVFKKWVKYFVLDMYIVYEKKKLGALLIDLDFF